MASMDVDSDGRAFCQGWTDRGGSGEIRGSPRRQAPRADMPSALSSSLLGNRQMCFLRTFILGTNPLGDLLRCQDTSRFHHRAFPMEPLGLHGVQPRTLTRQPARDDAHTTPGLLDVAVMRAQPRAYELAGVPRGIVPHEPPRARVQGRQAVTAPGQQLARQGPHGLTGGKPEPELFRRRRGGPQQHAIAGLVVRFTHNCRVSHARVLAYPARTWPGPQRCGGERSAPMRGPPPASRPALPPEFVEQANHIVHPRTVRYQLRPRARLVLLFHHPPLVSHTAAAACVARHPNAVRRWRRRWAHGHCVLEDESGRGPQPRLSPSGSRRGPSHRVRSGVRDGKAGESPSAGSSGRTRLSGAGHAHQPPYGLAEAPR